LAYNTTTMDDADKLLVYYDDIVANQRITDVTDIDATNAENITLAINTSTAARYPTSTNFTANQKHLAVWANVPFYLRFGGTVTSSYVRVEAYKTVIVDNADTYVSALAIGSAGTLYILGEV